MHYLLSLDLESQANNAVVVDRGQRSEVGKIGIKC